MKPGDAGIDRTHDPSLTSWVDSANVPGADFPIQNLPFGVCRRRDSGQTSIGVAIGDQILDLAACEKAGLLEGLAAASACTAYNLNAMMALRVADRKALRRRLVELLEDGTVPGRVRSVGKALVKWSEVDLLVPAAIGDFTDFYASVHHATNIGQMFRPDNPLLPNYKHLPIGYHGRASSVVPSGTPVTRPWGQTTPNDQVTPFFGPTRQLDYELELGAFVAQGNALRQMVPVDETESHLFGLVLLNDWSARDIQRWEYQPLGPFLAKSFATTISPWVVTLEALAPFRTAAFSRPESDPRPMPYLWSHANEAMGGVDVTVEALLQTAQMRARGLAPHQLSRANTKELYWTFGQMVAHHTSNGCNLRPGDLLGSGTISGPDKENRGCLQELTWRGAEPIDLPSGEQRSFLEDGDEIIFRGRCEREGFVGIGFGECRGVVESARALGPRE